MSTAKTAPPPPPEKTAEEMLKYADQLSDIIQRLTMTRGEIVTAAFALRDGVKQ